MNIAKSTTGRMASALALALAAALVAMAALVAAPSQAFAYDYTVRVLGGNEGTVAKDMASQTVSYGSTVRLDKSKVTLNKDSKYYVKGFRLAGQDDLYPEAFTVTEDMDIVVAYGVQGDMVPYTIHFVERGSNRVLIDPPITHYGNVGDKPVVAFEYIPGYRPLYRNITGTLKDSDNSFTFEYTALAEGETEDGGTTTTNRTNTTTTNTTTTTTTTTGGTTNTNNANTGTNTGANTGNANAANNDDEEESASAASASAAAAVPEGSAAAASAASASAAAPAANQPTTPPATQEILDTDNPLAQSASPTPESTTTGGASSAPLEGASNDEGIPMWVFWVIGIVVALAAAGTAFFFYRRRRQEEEELFY